MLTVEVGGRTQRLALVVPAQPMLAGHLATEREHIDAWLAYWDAQIESSADAGGGEIDFAGWADDVTGAPMDLASMRDWLAASAARVRAEAPRRILEIGAGAGNLALLLAGEVEEYVCTEPSPRSAERLRRRLDAAGRTGVRVLCQDACASDGLSGGRFDVVILNSVIQYFPSAAYLERVLDNARAAVRDGGAVYVGDVRNRATAPAYMTYVATAGLSPEPSPLLAAWLTNRAWASERELLVDSRFFDAWTSRWPDCSVAAMPRRGRVWSEMTRFRYDVVIRRAAAPPATAVAASTWSGSLPRLRGDADALLVANIPDARLQSALNAPVGGEGEPVDPEDLWDELGSDADVRLMPGDPRGRLQLLLGRAAAAASSVPPAAELIDDPRRRRARLESELALVRAVRTRLADVLDVSELPTAVVVVDVLPVEAAAPRCSRSPLLGPPAVPRSPLEHEVTSVWCEALLLEDAGRDDDFFALGGTGFLADGMLRDVAARTGVRVSIERFRCRPTIAAITEASATS